MKLDWVRHLLDALGVPGYTEVAGLSGTGEAGPR